MTTPVLILTLTLMVAAMAASVSDHASHAAATDLAAMRAKHAADALVETCLSDADCVLPSHASACSGADSVVITAEVEWSPRLWHALDTATATRYVAYDTGADPNPVLSTRLARAAAKTCATP